MIAGGSVLIVTGGGSGIGLATAAAWLKAGGRVAVLERNPGACERAAGEFGPEALILRADVTDEAAVAQAVADTVERFGALNAVFNNAGILGAAGPVEELSLDEWERVMAICVTGPFLVTKHAVSRLRAAGGGSVIMNASIAAIQGSAGTPAYGAAKGALLSLTASLARQLGRYRIRVNAICPGSVMGTDLAASGGLAPLTAAERAGILTRVPLGRLAAPEDIANTVLFLASDAARHMTGAVLRVDGGELAGR